MREKTRDGLSRRSAILAALERGPASTDDIVETLDSQGLKLHLEQVKSTLYGLSSRGAIENVGRGEWRIAEHVQRTEPAPTPAPSTDIGNLLELVGFDSQGRPLARTVDGGHTVYRLEAV